MPTIGKDLSKIRSHLGFSIQDVQHYTKIPASTLKSIEDGSIFDHPEENQTYIRSFVRSYGRALKIDDDVMIKALDQNETGNYNHLLLQEHPELAPEKPSQTKQKKETPTDFPEEESDPVKNKTPELKKDQQQDETTPEKNTALPEEATKPEDSEPKEINEPSVKNVDWANVGRKFSEEKKNTPIWIVGLIIFLIIAGFVGYFLYENGFFNLGSLTPQEQEQVLPNSETAQSSLSLSLDDSLVENPIENETTTPATIAELDDTLRLTVYAAYDGLGPVRVWSDLKPRLDPYWLSQGTAMHFEFRDTIRVRGTYSNLLLFKNGHLVENAVQEFFEQEDDYVELTRNYFSTDSKWATSIDYELPEGTPAPDSIATRPSF